ncbi:hypothetical protein ACLB2K_014553 [Fragaria x ananassa]
MSDYAFIIDRLVKTSKDVELLVSNEILENGLGSSSAAAAMINNLADGLTVDPRGCCYGSILKDLNEHCNLADGLTVDPRGCCYGSILKDLNEHCSNPQHQWREYLLKHFRNSTWPTKKTTAAVIFLVLSLIQTICLRIFIVLLS